MAKNIVVCSDGTGNSDISGRGSNVFKLFEAVELRANQQDPSLASEQGQVAIYHDGVGTESFKPIRILGGAFGYGFSRHVRQLYTELCRSYVPGDKIFLFGFSRGAFTVRTLAGLIAHVGILDVRKAGNDKELNKLVNKAYSALRHCFRRFGKWRKDPVNDRPAQEFRKNYAVEAETPIEFVGVWDTVDAVGFPLDEVADFWHNVVYPFRFPDTNLSSVVKCARHAISIDDERRTFSPELWNEDEETQKSGRIVQVWFAGVHSNVGGGYPKQGLSLIPLNWMMEEAESRGLRFVESSRQEYRELQNAHDKLYDSRAGLAGYYAYKPRDMEAICRKHNAPPRIHISVLERIAVGTNGYAPGNLTWPAQIVTKDPRVATRALTDIVTAAFDGPGKAKLQSLRGWISFWRVSQALFVAATLAVVALYVGVNGWRALADLASWKGYVQIGRILRDQPLVSGALVITYLACYLADNRLSRGYSEFWFGHRRQLRDTLWPKGHAAGA